MLFRSDGWRAKDCLKYKKNAEVIMPQYAVERLFELTKDKNTYITTEVGQHQMWAAQFYRFEEPNRWMTSGGLGTMGYGLPAAVGVQQAHPDALVIDIAGDASVLMTMQEMSTAIQYELPIKIFILNNQHMGMVRQWQQLLHGNRLSHSYTEALPDFVKLAEAYGCVGIRATKPAELDDAIKEMIKTPHPVLFDCRVANLAKRVRRAGTNAPRRRVLADKIRKPCLDRIVALAQGVVLGIRDHGRILLVIGAVVLRDLGRERRQLGGGLEERQVLDGREGLLRHGLSPGPQQLVSLGTRRVGDLGT